MSIPAKRQKTRLAKKKTSKNVSQALAAESAEPFSVTPLLGALLRITHEALTLGILASLKHQGIEMTETEFSVMRYPGPDGMRPIDLARRCDMTKQAMNYVLAGFESKGYIERRSSAGQRSTTIYLTPKGWKLLWQRAIAQQRSRRAGLRILEDAVSMRSVCHSTRSLCGLAIALPQPDSRIRQARHVVK